MNKKTIIFLLIFVLLGISLVSISFWNLLGVITGKVTLQESTLSEWKFDEGTGNITKDSVGNNNGTIHGAAWSGDCVSNSCLEFDGIDDYVNAGNDTSLDFGSEDFSIEAWVKLTGGSGHHTILSKGEAGIGDNKGVVLRVERSGKVKFFVTGNSEISLSSGTTIHPGKWNHIVATKSSSIKLYINGMSGSFRGAPKGSVNSDIPLYIGRYGDLEEYYFNGVINDVRIYKGVLSIEQIKDLHDKCVSNTNYGCYDNDVYWYDSCGKRENKKEECETYECKDGICKEEVDEDSDGEVDESNHDLECSGCVYNQGCLGYGFRFVVDDVPIYCGLNKQIQEQKADDVLCDNNYECLSNKCSNGVCVSFVEEINLKDNLLWRMFCAIIHLVNCESRCACMTLDETQSSPEYGACLQESCS